MINGFIYVCVDQFLIGGTYFMFKYFKEKKNLSFMFSYFMFFYAHRETERHLQFLKITNFFKSFLYLFYLQTKIKFSKTY
jgi:hypothetical protein